MNKVVTVMTIKNGNPFPRPVSVTVNDDDLLLIHLLRNDLADDVDDFIGAWDERAYYATHPDEFADIPWHWWEDDLRDLLTGYEGSFPTEDDVKSLRRWWSQFFSDSEG